MSNFIVIEKDSLNKVSVNAERIVLSESSIVHTKMNRDDVAEFIRDGNNLILKLTNGEVVVIENFFVVDAEGVTSDLVFEEDGCVLYWFDGVSGFKGIPGLEALLPAVESSQLVGLLPWLVGAAVVGGAAAIIDHNDKDKTESIPNGTNTLKVNTDGTVTGKTENIPEGTDVKINISGKDKDGNNIEYQDIVKVDKDGNYVTDVPPNFADGDLVVESEVIDRNGNTITAEDKLGTGKTDDPATPGDESEGLDREPGSITVEIVETGLITGTTTDVAPGTDVVLTITGTDANGNPVTVSKTVTTDASGNYSSAVTAADGIVDGSAVTVVANTTDRNGQGVGPATDSIAAQGDNDNDPSTPEDTGLDLVAGAGAGSGPDILAGDIGGLKTNFAVGHNYNISIILDISGSMVSVMTNGQTRLEVAKKALQAFVDQMAQHDGIINLRITTFDNNAVAVIQDVVVSNGTVTSIKNTIDQIEARDDTNPETAFTDVDNWLNSKTNGYENQIYYLTDGAPSVTNLPSRDVTFANLAAKSKVFAVGVGLDVPLDWVERYDNTDANGNKINNWSPTNHGEAQKIGDADKLLTYLISGSDNFTPADVGNDTVKGGAGDDILFGDAMNTNWITGLDPLQYPKYSGYSKLTAHLKATVTGGAEPTQQQVYDYVKANYKQFIAADAADPATKGGDDTIYGGSGDDIIIAGAGNDTVYGGSGNDVISTGRGDDTIMFDVLNAADATGGNGKDTWVDYEANDKIEFGTGFFDGLLSSDLSNAGKVGAFISVANDGLGNTVVKVDRDGAGGNHTMSDLLVLENKTGVTLQDLLNNNQIIIG